MPKGLIVAGKHRDNTKQSPSTPELKIRRGGRLTSERRAEIIRKAGALFLEKGYESVTVDEIIVETGGSKATVYTKFGGKAGLFEAAIEQHCDNVNRGLSLNFDATESLEHQLIRIGNAFMTLLLDQRTLRLHRLIVSLGDQFPDLSRTFFEAGPSATYRMMAQWIERHQKSGALREGSPALFATLFLDMLTGRHQLARLTGVKTAADDVSATVEGACTLFLSGLKRQPE